MIKAIWFAVKVGLLIMLAVWVADRPGDVRFEWLDYVVTIDMGLFLLIVLGINLLAIFSYQILRAITGFPASLRRYNEIMAREKGYRALTIGLSAVAAGDTKAAVAQARKVRKFLPDDRGLPQLLAAQAARLDGREDDAVRGFAAMLESKDASFLGVRGLLQSALDSGDYETARDLADRALALHPKQAWILRISYDIYVRLRDWSGARSVLKRAVKAGAIDAERGRDDRAAMLMVEADAFLAAGHNDLAVKAWNAARREAADFAPATLALVQYYVSKGAGRKARDVLEKAWKASPHDLYVRVWSDLLVGDEGHDSLARLKHMARLLKLGGASAMAQREAGRAALDAGLWGEARDYFEACEEIAPSAELYRLLARLEEASMHDDEAAKIWLGKAAGGAADKAWVCRESGQVLDVWRAIMPFDGAFNTLEWRAPMVGASGVLGAQGRMVDALIEAPMA